MIILRIIRAVFGRIVIVADWLTRPKKTPRSEDDLANLARESSNLSLYQFYACPFCVKTRRAIHRLNIPIELRDAKTEGEHRTALLEGGGRVKVPCLRIDEDGGSKWMYESSTIIEYLESRFA